VIGTAGLSDFCGTDPVMATVMMQGVVMTCSLARVGWFHLRGCWPVSSVCVMY
jgi:hypothetical protein